LSTKPDIAPVLFAALIAIRRLSRLAEFADRNACRSLAQINKDASPFPVKAIEHFAQELTATEDVLENILAVQPRRHGDTVANASKDKSEVMNVVEGRGIGNPFACPISVAISNSPTQSTSRSRRWR
jgi:hypothetical protein